MEEKKGIAYQNPEQEKEEPLSRAEIRRQKRAEAKAKNPPKYGPVVIFTERYQEVPNEDKKGVRYERYYTAVTNIKHLQNK